MAQRARWRELWVGVAATAGVLLIGALIMVFGRVGALHGKTFRVYVATDGARGVIRGTDVWLDGQKVGLVRSVGFQPPSAPPSQRLVLGLDILDGVRQNIRADSRISIRSGATLIGDQVVYMSSGTAAAAPVSAGDTIRATQADVESATAEAAATAREFPAILANIKLLGAQLQSAQGAVGAFLGDQGGANMQRVRGQTERLMNRLGASGGLLSMTVSGRAELVARAEQAMSQVDSIRELLGSDRHSLGRFRRDSTLSHEIAAVRLELAEVQRLASSPTGTIGRIHADSAIALGVRHDLASLDSLLADLKKHPLRYIAF
jgi:phospholipid/cholesterol/gamma-HCH transport system substrate-binding protein